MTYNAINQTINQTKPNQNQTINQTIPNQTKDLQTSTLCGHWMLPRGSAMKNGR